MLLLTITYYYMSLRSMRDIRVERRLHIYVDVPVYMHIEYTL